MTCLAVSLDALAIWRDQMGEKLDLVAAAILADLAGADRIRLTVREELQPVTEIDLHRMVQAVPHLELCVPPSQHLIRLALEVRPSRVLLVEEDRYRRCAYGPLDMRKATGEVSAIVRALEEAGIVAGAVIAPDSNELKAAHAIGFQGVDLFTRFAADLPAGKRAQELARLSDASLLGAKLKFYLGISGGLDYRNIGEVSNAVSNAVQVTVGRSVLVRALFNGLDRAVRDFRALVS
jgi:pyridoxine 5-phosphate synthase